MMRRFDVALPTWASAEEGSLVPQLVPGVRPSLRWTRAEGAGGRSLVRLLCRLDYEADGLMARIIAATEPYHCYIGDEGLFWQEGVFLEDSSYGNQALVTVDGRERPLVSIVVSGGQPGFLMNKLHKVLEEVISFWDGMTRTYAIQCSTQGANGTYCAGRHLLRTVERRNARKDRRALDYQICDEEFQPEELLYGLQAVAGRRGRKDESADLREIRHLVEFLAACRT